MIDFVKLVVYLNNPRILLLNPLLNFGSMVNTDSGELLEHKRKATYRGLVFTVYPTGRVDISGSLHKYVNNGEHNYNDFTRTDLLNVIAELEHLFNINPLEARLTQFEYGVNINTSFNPKNLIDSLIHYNNTPFHKVLIRKRETANIVEAELTNYRIKAYNKGLQYGQKQNIFRYEVHIKDMEKVKKWSIATLYDLTKPNILELLANDLSSMFNLLLIDNPNIKNHDLKRTDLKVIQKCRERNIWEPDNKELSKSKRYQYNRRFREIIETIGPNILQEETAKLIKEKCEYLLKTCNVLKEVFHSKTCDVLKTIPKQNMRRFGDSYIVTKRRIHSTPETLENKGKNKGFSVSKKRACKTCGCDISHRRSDSIFCEKKKCRNADSNPRNNFNNKIEREKQRGLLFDILPYFKIQQD